MFKCKCATADQRLAWMGWYSFHPAPFLQRPPRKCMDSHVGPTAASPFSCAAWALATIHDLLRRTWGRVHMRRKHVACSEESKSRLSAHTAQRRAQMQLGNNCTTVSCPASPDASSDGCRWRHCSPGCRSALSAAGRLNCGGCVWQVATRARVPLHSIFSTVGGEQQPPGK